MLLFVSFFRLLTGRSLHSLLKIDKENISCDTAFDSGVDKCFCVQYLRPLSWQRLFATAVCLFAPICEFYTQTFMWAKTYHVGVTNLEDLTPGSYAFGKRTKFCPAKGFELMSS